MYFPGRSGTDILSELTMTRTRYFEATSSRASSTAVKPSEAKKLQEPGPNKGPQFEYGRPPEAAGSVPVTLRHPVFNEFIDACIGTADEPSVEDNVFALDLTYKMSLLYESEQALKSSFIETCQDHDLSFASTKIVGTDYQTDGDMRTDDGFIHCITEMKWEAGALGAEPILQSGLYYKEYIRRRELDSRSSFPCLGVSLVGEPSQLPSVIS